MRSHRFTHPTAAQILMKYVNGHAPKALDHALRQAGIDPALVKAQMPNVLKHFIPALGSSMATELYNEGGAICAADGSMLLKQIEHHLPNAGNVSMQAVAVASVNGQPQVAPDASNPADGDFAPSFTSTEEP